MTSLEYKNMGATTMRKQDFEAINLFLPMPKKHTNTRIGDARTLEGDKGPRGEHLVHLTRERDNIPSGSQYAYAARGKISNTQKRTGVPTT